MSDKFREFLDSLVYYLKEHGDLVAIVKPTDDKDVVDIDLFVEGEEEEEGEEVGGIFLSNFYIGSYAEPGMRVTWLGPFTIADRTEDLVMVNGVVISANARTVTGWAIGLQ